MCMIYMMSSDPILIDKIFESKDIVDPSIVIAALISAMMSRRN